MAGSPELAAAIRTTAERLGINPSDLATAISYETGGTFSPSLWGGKGGNYLGLIQFGPEERQKYGVRPDQSVPEQMGAVENFLRDRGVKPGMGLLDVYSTINAGRPGLYNRSDAANGGAPGTVADKVATQMYGHRMRANALFGDSGGAASGAVPAAVPAPSAGAPSAPSAIADGGASASPESMSPQLLASLQEIPKMLEEQSRIAPPPPMDVLNADPIGMARARALARAMAARPIA